MSNENLLYLPGFVEVHAHLREPSTNTSESIASGTRAALFGGYVMLGDMPNNPKRQTWYESRMLEKHDIARTTAYIPTTYHAGAQPEHDTVGELEKMANLSLWLKLYGGITTGNPRDYEAAEFRDIVQEWDRVAKTKPIGFHAGQNNLEDMINLVAGEFSHPMHVHHVSRRSEIMAISRALGRGLPVTCGVCPHHLLKSSFDTHSEGWFARVQPPLVDQAEAEELMHYLAEGTIDIVETDHAPHSLAKKFETEHNNPDAIIDEDHQQCFGLPGIDFAGPLLLYQAKRGRIDPGRLVTAMSARPAEILGIRLDRTTQVGWEMAEYRIDSDSMTHSYAQWMPYLGKLAFGRAKEVTIGGRSLMINGEIVARDSRVITERDSMV